MTFEEIKHQLNQMSRRLLDKGMRTPNATLQIHADSQCYGQVTYYEDDEFRTKTEWQDDPGIALNVLWNHIREIPEKAERERNNYLRKIASAVEYGKKVGIDDSLINPLVEQMKRLSSNIIEHKPEGVWQIDPRPVTELDPDEMPF